MSKNLLSPFSVAAVLVCTAILPTAFAQEATKPAPAPVAATDGFVPLFDGKTLAGWTNPYSFGKAEVVNGEIHLTAEKKFFLCTDKPYANFVFEGDVHLPEGKANSGFIFRGIIKEDAKKEKVEITPAFGAQPFPEKLCMKSEDLVIPLSPSCFFHTRSSDAAVHPKCRTLFLLEP